MSAVGRPALRWAATTALCSSQTSVTGPTPPGTGVTARARSATAAKSTSPTMRTRPSGSVTGLMPTSITIACAPTCSALIRPARPAATMSTSAARVWRPRVPVRLAHSSIDSTAACRS